MRIYRTTPTRGFTPLANTVLQDRRLSLGALGVLVHLLSLKDGTKVDIKSLAAEFQDSQARIAGYFHELVLWGYMIRRKFRDPETREIRTVVSVQSDPLIVVGEDLEVVSVEVVPSLSGPSLADSSASPSGIKTREKTPPQEPLPFAELGGDDASLSDEQAAGAALLARLGRAEPRLYLGAAEMLPLLPLLAEWKAVGASEALVRQVLSEGLPARIFSVAALMKDRLTRKMPGSSEQPTRRTSDVYSCCDECHRPVVGSCGFCTGAERSKSDEVVEATMKGARLARQLLRTASS
jgi:hypothetical protein